MKIKKKQLISHPNVNRVNPLVLKGKKTLESVRVASVYTSKKLLAVFLSLTMTSGMLGATPVYADSNVEATTSGDVSEEKQSNEPTPVKCSGGISLSDTSNLSEGDGELVCAQSNGYYTEITGNETPSSYHWVAWYKDKLKNDVDITDTEGNYSGFSDSKVIAWQPYADEIKDLNDGDFPETKSYTYPTDTTTGALDFWTDLAGYYTVIGDPKYDDIEITAYEQLVYAKQTTDETREKIAQAGDASEYSIGDDGALYQITTDPETGEEKTTKVEDGDEYTTGWSGYDEKGITSREKYYTEATGTVVHVVQKHSTSGYTSILVERKLPNTDKWITDTTYNGDCYWDKLTDVKKGDTSSRTYNVIASIGSFPEILGLTVKDVQENWWKERFNKNNTFNNMSFGKSKIEKSWEGTFQLLSEEDGDATSYIETTSDGQYMVTKVNHITYYYTNVEIAKASIDGSVYASQLAQLPDLKITKGYEGNKVIKTNNNEDSFWKTTVPTYWGNDGKITLKNNSAMPYHFAAVSSNSSYDEDDDSIISLYATLPQTDKEFTFTHAYSNIKNTDLSSKQYPSSIEENCVTTKTTSGSEKQICSKKQTPLIKVKMNIDEDNPQEDVDDEVEKSVTLTKDNDKESDSSIDSSEATSD